MNSEKNPGRILLVSLLMVVLGIVVQVVSSYVLDFILRYFPSLQADYSELLTNLTRPTVLRILYVALFAPIMEELIFRYGIMNLVGRFAPFIVANLVQAALFGLYHFDFVQSSYAFLLGLLIGYVVKRYHSVYYGILFHISINVTGLIMTYCSTLIS